VIRVLPLLALLLAADAPAVTASGQTRALRVCADPNNLPFSNQREEGFENRLATLIANDLGRRVEYTWWAQRRGFVRNTLRAGACDLIPGIPAGFEPLATTAAYYRSTYVFVARAALGPPIESFDDPRLRRLTIGVHLIGDDYANPPPVAALARRGIVRNVRGYTIYGDYREPNPPARLIDAVARAEVDVAIVWGPLGGYFGSRAAGLRVTPVPATEAESGIPFVFAIAMGLRPADSALAREIDAVLARRGPEIRRILQQYHVPLIPAAPEAS
jgi:mxaJ protein